MKKGKILFGASIFCFFGAFVMFMIIFDKTESTNFAIFGMIFYAGLGYLFLFLSNKIRKKYNEEPLNFKKIFSAFSKEKRMQRKNEKLEFEKLVKKQFNGLDILTINAIAEMLSQTKEKYNKAISFNSELLEVDISLILLDFCKDSFNMIDAYELNNLYTNNYYRKKVSKFLFTLEKHIKNHIVRSVPSNQYSQAVDIYKQYINLTCDIVSQGEMLKFLSAISNTQNVGSLEQIEEIFKKIDYKYRDLLLYLVDILQTCTCISKMLFVERKINELDVQSEFYKIIFNMAKEIENIDLIIKKSKPIYEEFYKSELGFIDDELLYSIGVTIMVNKIKQKPISKTDYEILNIKDNIQGLNSDIKIWLDELAQSTKVLEIERYLLFKITLTVNNDFEMIIKYLGVVNYWSNYYYKQVSYNKKKNDKDRYLAGDFEKEKKEQSEKYSLNNIVTGAQFEQYLEMIFKELGYKVKNNGKSGDQGADLILKKDDYVYVVQAKYYTSPLGNTPVQEIVGALKYYNSNQGVVVTNSTFTKGAESLAQANNVILIDGKDLKKLVDSIFEDNIDEDILQKFMK